MRKFKLTRQVDAMDCGPSCLRMVAESHGQIYPLEYLRENCFLTRDGVSLLGISEAAEKIGFHTMAVKVNISKLIDDAPLPCILHWNQNHFIVLYRIHGAIFYIADPSHGLLKLSENEFKKSWLNSSLNGVALLLETTPKFHEISIEENLNFKPQTGFLFLAKYLKPYKTFIFQIFLSMIVGSGLSLILPFLTQSLVDKGINHKNVSFVKLILISQLVLFVVSTAVNIIRSWLSLHMNARLNILTISDFLIKLMHLPISYFDSKLVGDIQQRIGDHARVQTFLTGSALTTLFSIINLIVFAFILGYYSASILAVFLLSSLMGVGWILLFLKRRKRLDYVRFQRMGDNQNVMFEMITAMQEIKLNNCETQKRWGWEKVQAKLFHLNIKSLVLGQYQQVGSVFLNQTKNILISYISAREVIAGNMTLGMMMSVSYIIGQMNSPVDSLLTFIQGAQDAKISLDRLGEIHSKEDEDSNVLQSSRVNELCVNGEDSAILVKEASYQYEGPKSPYAVKNINLKIPKGKVTAIVGASGSGKTTLVKLLLQFYKPTEGAIFIDNVDLQKILPKVWRSNCGSVMQEGYVFSDTIANNIALGVEKVDHNKLKHAVEVANIKEFIDELPLNYNTKIGLSGSGISSGQKQRILIARAVYKNPDFLFFDEATSALDANNEKVIINNLDEFFKDKTVVIVAHRLSTVKHADQIVVLEKGEIREVGTHNDLVKKSGLYYELIKNQLELGQ